MTLAARHGELAGHMHGYEPALIMRGIVQTVADRRLTYLAMPDEASLAIADRWPMHPPGHRYESRCMVPWRDEARQFTYYCLLDAGHDDETRFAVGLDYAVDDAAVALLELELEAEPEHGWYKLLDAYERGAQAMTDAVDRIEARRQAALGRLEGERLDALRHGA